MAKRVQKRNIPLIPKDIEHVAELLAVIADEQREVEKIEAKLNEEVEGLKLEASEKAQEHVNTINDMLGAIFLFGDANRKELTDSGRVKTIKTPTGSFGWRINPPSVEIRGKMKTVITALKKAGLVRFIRSKPELNKEAMLLEPDVATTIKGIKIKRDEEDFFVKLDQETLGVDEVISSVKKLRKIYA